MSSLCRPGNRKNDTFRQKLDVPRCLRGERIIQTGQPGAASQPQPRPLELCERQSCVRLGDERKAKSQTENSLLFHPGINSGGSGLLTSVQSPAAIFNFTSARCSLI